MSHNSKKNTSGSEVFFLHYSIELQAELNAILGKSAQ